MVTFFVKIADMVINRHNSISRETCAIFVFDVARERLATGLADWCFHVNAVQTPFWNETHSGMKLITAPESVINVSSKKD